MFSLASLKRVISLGLILIGLSQLSFIPPPSFTAFKTLSSLTAESLILTRIAALSFGVQMAGVLAVDNDTIVVGPFHPSGSTKKAYIHERNQGGTNQWGRVIELTESDAASYGFGTAVAVDGDTVIVGAGDGLGAIYVYDRNQDGADQWGLVTQLLPSDSSVGDRFGKSIAISGDTILVGAYGLDQVGSDSGAAYIFYRDQGGPNQWGQVLKLTPSDAAAGDNFGFSVALEGDTALVAAPGVDDPVSDAGAVYVFERNQAGLDQWGQTAKIRPSDIEISSLFGKLVDLSGDTFIASAQNDAQALTNSDVVYVFERDQADPTQWDQMVKLAPKDAAENDYFGTAIAISGDLILVGEPHSTYVNLSLIHLFARQYGCQGSWGEIATRTGGGASDAFGSRVALDGNTALAHLVAISDYVYVYEIQKTDNIVCIRYLPIVYK